MVVVREGYLPTNNCPQATWVGATTSTRDDTNTCTQLPLIVPAHELLTLPENHKNMQSSTPRMEKDKQKKNVVVRIAHLLSRMQGDGIEGQAALLNDTFRPFLRAGKTQVMYEGQHVLSERFLKAWHVTHQDEQGLCLAMKQGYKDKHDACDIHRGGGEVKEYLPRGLHGLEEATLCKGCPRWDCELLASRKLKRTLDERGPRSTKYDHACKQ